MIRRLALLTGLSTALGVAGLAVADDKIERNFAGSVQLDYLAVPTEKVARFEVLDGATVEVSLKMAMDFGDHVSANVKVCVACHGMETGMAFFDLRLADEANLRVGRFTPAFGAFPLRHDPANHRTSDKPLPYDMGRMVRFREWNEGVLPAPWVDNGVELDGTHFFGERVQLDYAAYLTTGPKGDADAVDFDYKLSRTPERYYVDNNSQPVVGARVSSTIDVGSSSNVTVGLSGMAGHYDPEARLAFVIAGADATFQRKGLFVRAEYLARRTEISLGDDPAGRFKYGAGPDGSFAGYTLRDGFYGEVEVPAGPFELIARTDGLRHFGNVLATSPLRSESIVVRYTAGLAYHLPAGLRLKASAELYDFSDFDDELAIHTGIAGPF